MGTGMDVAAPWALLLRVATCVGQSEYFPLGAEKKPRSQENLAFALPRIDTVSGVAKQKCRSAAGEPVLMA